MYQLNQLVTALRAKGANVTEAQVSAYIAAQGLTAGPGYNVTHVGAVAVATNFGVTL